MTDYSFTVMSCLFIITLSNSSPIKSEMRLEVGLYILLFCKMQHNLALLICKGFTG